MLLNVRGTLDPEGFLPVDCEQFIVTFLKFWGLTCFVSSVFCNDPSKSLKLDSKDKPFCVRFEICNTVAIGGLYREG
jgi:hypothetical protein